MRTNPSAAEIHSGGRWLVRDGVLRELKFQVRPAVFLDRDGVMNVFPGPGRFVLAWDMFHFMPGVREELRRLREHGFFLALITNQSGVGRGLMDVQALHEIHVRMQSALEGDALDAIYYCAHHPDAGCACRKPSPEMILRACADHALDPSASFMVGDSGRDMQMGRAAGCRTILCRENLPAAIDNLKPEHRPDRMCKTLHEAVEWICSTGLRAGRDSFPTGRDAGATNQKLETRNCP